MSDERHSEIDEPLATRTEVTAEGARAAASRITVPQGEGDAWPSFGTWCSLCGDGQQEARRDRVEDDEAVYRSYCAYCADGFDVRIAAGTPESERKAFLKWGGSRWAELSA